MTRLRTTVVTAFAGTGGSESWLLELLRATDELEVDVVTLGDGPLVEQLRGLGLPVVVHPVGRRPSELLSAAVWLRRHLRRRSPAVVLGNVLKAGLVVAPAARTLGIPWVLAKHDHVFDRSLAWPVGRAATRVVAAVEELAEATRRSDAVIIPPPRPSEEPLPRELARRELERVGLRLGTRPVLVMAGRLVPFKAIEDAIGALAHDGGAGWDLAVLGTDDPAAPGETERLRAVAARLGVADRVQFGGHVPRAAALLRAFDAMAVLTREVNPGDPAREGFGTAAFEAMLAGIPVIAAGGSAVARRLEGRAGVVIPAGDLDAIAGALQLLTDPLRRQQMGEAGRELTAAHPDAAACAALLVAVLRDAAAQSRRSRRA